MHQFILDRSFDWVNNMEYGAPSERCLVLAAWVESSSSCTLPVDRDDYRRTAGAVILDTYRHTASRAILHTVSPKITTTEGVCDVTVNP